MSAWFGETISPKDRNPDTLACALANYVAMAMAHDLRVELRVKGGGRRVGRIMRREIQPELFEQERDVRWQKGGRVSSVVAHLDDGGGPLPLNDVSDIRSLRDA